jgi:hypothetical protein
MGRGLGIQDLYREIDAAKMLTAHVLIDHMTMQGVVNSIQEAEFKVFSQFGDDGIIQFLIRHVGIRPENRSFIEFGVENYEEANTRFLLMNNNWRGLILDGDPGNIAHVKASEYYWKHDLTAVAAFIDRESVNDLFVRYGFAGEMGLLSIDIDGNDYWVWERIEVVKPVIVVVEYNSIFGARHAVTIPYSPTFHRLRAHYSNLYWGCSLKALCLLAQRKGYTFIGCNSAGNNAYFVQKERLGPLKGLSAEEGYVPSRFRESRSQAGELTFVSGQDRLRVIQEMEVFDVERNQLIKIANCLA